MKIGIIGAMEEEIRLLKQTIEEMEEVVKYGQHFYVGRLFNHEVVLVQSGIGKVNATITATLLVELFDVELMINTGTAGGLHPALKVGDIVIADSLTYHDVDVTGFGYKMGQMAGMPACYYSHNEYVLIAKNACRQLGIEPILGQIVSGDQFVNHQDTLSEIKTHFPLAKACEMESTAIAQTAHVLKVPFVIIRAISDSADEQASMSFDEFVVIAGKASATMVIKTIELL